MKQLDVNDLRALIRLIPSVRALREDTEKSIHLELYSGAGDLAVRTFRGLRDSIAQITDDPYIAALDIDVYQETKDRQKVSQVLMGTGQLLSYLEAQTGTQGLTGERRGNYSVQTAPNIHLDMGDVIGGQLDRVMDIVNGAMKGIPKMPKAPKPPKPPRPPGRDREVYFYQDDDDEDDEG